jgi:cell volume regulation protein A
MSFVGLRGAVSILLAILPITAGLERGQYLFDATFIIVLVSLVVQGWTIRPLARWLGVAVPPRIGPVERVELELPGTALHELVVYHITEGSPVARGHRLPRWAMPSLVVREGRSYRRHRAGRLRPDDYVYIFTSPPFIPLLDRLFASRGALPEADQAFYGALVIAPDAPLAALAESYGITVAGSDADETVAGFLRRQFDGRLEIGDRMVVGPIDLIVRNVDDNGAATEIGLSLERVDRTAPPEIGLVGRGLARLRQLLGARPPAAALRDAVESAKRRLPGP